LEVRVKVQARKEVIREKGSESQPGRAKTEAIFHFLPRTLLISLHSIENRSKKGADQEVGGLERFSIECMGKGYCKEK
jgi:hypothetical protein